ncbi:MAG: hypothetical protein HC863_01150, partial [Myxococcales bacterium]|nr:hypothetical protein [Myxococcales bacterium]
MQATARPPNPNVIPSRTYAGSVALDTSTVPEATLCSSHGGRVDFCVDRFRSAHDTGLTAMLGRYVPGGTGPTYRAVFRLVQFSHSPTGTAVQVAMRWQFEMYDGERPIVRLANTTVGPENLVEVRAADRAVKALLDAVLEGIAAELNKAPWIA